MSPPRAIPNSPAMHVGSLNMRASPRTPMPSRTFATACWRSAEPMRAVRLHGIGDLRVEEVPPPAAPEPGWAGLKVLAAGICGSDLHNFRTGQWISRAPSTPGHELCGEITAVGAGVEGLSVGDRVVADSRFWCGTCEACRAGRPNLCERLGYVGEVCDGGFAEELILPVRLLHKVPGFLDPAIAATAEPLQLPCTQSTGLPCHGPSRSWSSATGPS